jgi:CHAD domain-containing protein
MDAALLLQPSVREATHMLGTPTLTSLLDRQAYRLRTQLDGVYDGAVDAVHDARVATRRIRELLALVPSVPGRDGEDETARGYKKMGRALGKVRDVDVQIGLVRNLEDHAPQTAPSLLLVRQRHEAERMTRTRALVKTLERIEVEALLKAVADGHPAGLRRRMTASGWRQQLRRLLGERAQAAVETIVHATGIYFPRRAHGARIAIKQLRYAVEIAQATGLSDVEAAGKVLRKGQEVLGDLHDRQALADTLAGYGKDEGVDLEHIQLARQVLLREVMQLHAQYLARRTALRAACAEIEQASASAWRPGPVVAVGAALTVSGLLFGRRMLAGKAQGS